MAKTSAQLDREIAQALRQKRSSRHHATVLTAAPHVEAIKDAIYRTKDPEALVAAVKAANQHRANMRRLARRKFVADNPEYKDRPGLRYSAQTDSSGEYDPAMYELGNLLVAANEMVRRIKIKKKTGRFPKVDSRTAWKTRGF
ncbi:MAG TPA: hypothetical protein VLE97_08710 [Gaiellaceae bacterium]|nr:hypothetical protein [Gaiellaceae bacterium]